MADFVYGNAVLAMLLGSGATQTVDYLADTIQVGLSTSTHVPNKDDNYLDDAGADDFVDGEIGVGGYARQTLASKAMTYDAANDRVELDAVDTVFTSLASGATIAQATVHEDQTTDATSRVVANVDSGGFPVATNGGNITIQWNAEGIIQFTV